MISTLIVDSSFHAGFYHSLNWPTALAVMVAGLLSGFSIGLSHRKANTVISPGMVMLLAGSMLVAMQAALGFGLSTETPGNASAYIGNHIGVALLSILCGACAGPGVWLAQRMPAARPDVSQ